MIRLIGFRCKHSDVLSREVLIGRISCKECCTSHKSSKIGASMLVSEVLLGTVFIYGFCAKLPPTNMPASNLENFWSYDFE